MQNLHHGMNRRDLDRILVSLGGTVRHLPRTGEIQYSHPLMHTRPRANGRRKDAGRHLTSFVMALQRVQEGGCGHTRSAA